MYATMTSSSASVYSPKNSSSMYRQIGIETGVGGASPHQLVGLLLNGALEAIAQARGAIQSGQVEVKCKAISKAVGIVDEGLKACLDLKSGGTLAANLNDLYGYVTMRLTHANLHSDDQALEECANLLSPLRDAWAAIGSDANEQERATYLKGLKA
ncbi:MAG: flagellar export chaperone FliS [Burkholderiales bacterium]|nr:flagellar export chaperone FliS [Burkholderiales bacterium]